jgi:predicted cobalt transporter CbtA
VRNLLIRGLLVGLLAGLVAFVVASTIGEPSVDAAIAYEDAQASTHATHEAVAVEKPSVSRSTQKGLGLATGLVVYGTALGGIFAVGFALAYGRLGRLSARATSAWLAGAGFVVLVLVPFLKYPAAPPAASLAETIDARTQHFFVFLLLSAVMAALAVALGRQVARTQGSWPGVLAGIGVYLVGVGAEMALAPAAEKVPVGFDPNVLWDFRVASLAMHLTIWVTLGLLFGYLTERGLRRAAAQQSSVPLQSASVL